MNAPWPEPDAGCLVIAVLGAECTGKSTLTEVLARRLSEDTGWACVQVGEYLRDWCEAKGRTPRPEEQAGIALEQARRIAAASREHRVVVADTTPLVTAVYHQEIFGLDSLDAQAVAWHRRCTFSLLTALDLPWQADAHQRDSPAVQARVDARVRAMLVGAGLPFAVVRGRGPARLESALDAVSPTLRRRAQPGRGLFTRLAEREAGQPAWPWRCDDCDLPDCEHALQGLRR